MAVMTGLMPDIARRPMLRTSKAGLSRSGMEHAPTVRLSSTVTAFSACDSRLLV